MALALLAAFAVQAGIAAQRDSVTIDEFVHLPVGLHLLERRDFHIDPINPPLPRMLFALPVRSSGAELPDGAREGHWRFAGSFMRANFFPYHPLFVRARAAAIGVALLLGIVVFAWARELAGPRAGLLALLLFAFSPSLLAHGHLVTLDVAGALGATLTLFLFWRFLGRPGPAAGAAVGAALGLALLCKLSALFLAPALLVSLVVELAGSGRRRASAARWLGGLALAPATALVVVNLGYLGSDTFRPLAEASFLPEGTLARLQEALPQLRLPLPLPFLEGIDHASHVAVARTEYFFLLGELSTTGWWYYHLVAFLVKTPLPLLGLALVAAGVAVARRPPGLRLHALVVPLLLLFAANALFNSQSIGVRHVLTATPLLFVGVSPLLAAALEDLPGQWRRRRSRSASLVAAAALVWFVAGSLAVAPRYLQYFNELAGGPDGGHRVLVDSNLDWGQDLIRLKEYMDAEGLERVALAYFGRVHPHVYGIDFVPLERDTREGVAVVSASFLMGRPYYWVYRGRPGLVPPNAYAWLRERQPSRRVGSLFVYELP
ncbi:MAG: glycosyltransferase family 39 protein [Myxococcota bacterium]|nr:glycosyltransferase family 39 protein [Myxococcota bacterium]